MIAEECCENAVHAKSSTFEAFIQNSAKTNQARTQKCVRFEFEQLKIMINIDENNLLVVTITTELVGSATLFMLCRNVKLQDFQDLVKQK